MLHETLSIYAFISISQIIIGRMVVFICCKRIYEYPDQAVIIYTRSHEVDGKVIHT